MLKDNIYDYKRIYADQRIEFQSITIMQMYKKLDITWYTTYSKDIKTSIFNVESK